MAIAFNCACGKHLKARDEFAGRKIKCPSCQTILVIPAATPAVVSVPTAPEPSPPPAPEPVLHEDPMTVPLARPVAMKVPEAVIPFAAMPPSNDEARPVPRTAVSAVPLPNPWADRSLEQTVTPWLGDDRERFNHGMEFREGSRLWLALVALFVVAALSAAFFFA